jgi:hypothetical protein
VLSCAWVGLNADRAAAGSAYDALARTDVSTVTIGNESIPTGIDIEPDLGHADGLIAGARR